MLLIPFWRANRRLIVNASTGAHLTLISGNANRRLVLSVLPEVHLFSPQRNVNRRPVVNALPEAHLSLASLGRLLPKKQEKPCTGEDVEYGTYIHYQRVKGTAIEHSMVIPQKNLK